jgi:hypothetical protein
MLELNRDKLQTVTVETFDRTRDQGRWQTAIVKAKIQLESNPFLEWQDGSLLILSCNIYYILTLRRTSDIYAMAH